jgi:TetR/AcrR family tetracycline transcriptional repressor
LSSGRRTPPKTALKLDRASIVKAAFAVLSEKGLDGLSLRELASRLGVKAPALYWHVHNKAELIDMMAATFSASAVKEQQKEKTWTGRLLAYGHGLRQAMLRFPDAARLCSSARPLEDPDVQASRIAAPLIAAGLDIRRALSFQASVIAYTLGWVIYEQSQPMHEHLAHMIDFGDSFGSGLQAMVRGFALAVEERDAVRTKQRRLR